MSPTRGAWGAAALAVVVLVGLESALHGHAQVDSVPRTPQVSECREVTGPCGNWMFNQPTFYFDRVRFSCPDEAPILRGLRYDRCGPREQPSEGLLIIGNCCAFK